MHTEPTVTYRLAGMHCGSCVAKLTAALEARPEIVAAAVTLDPPRAVVTPADGRLIDDAAVEAAVAAAGDYTATRTAGAASDAAPPASEPDGPPESLYPLGLIVAYLAGTVLLIAATSDDWSWMRLMSHVMAGFFLVFSFFKLLDLRGFATTFRGYDLFARASKAYAYGYPFLELGLGIAYLTGFAPVVTNSVTLVVMGVGAVGVLRVLLDRRQIRCACLGTALNLPMTKVTLIEDLAMFAMAAGMLVGLGLGR